MQPNWAAENLQVIRTLMERSALYRRALAPIVTFLGVIGIAAALAARKLNIERTEIFAIYWMAVSAVGLVGAFFLVRRQALKHEEKFWSPPTRRIAQAMLPALLIGLALGLMIAIMVCGVENGIAICLVISWSLLYGLALQAAGFFMPRGIRLFGWGFLLAGLIILTLVACRIFPARNVSPHCLMGALFGGGHLAYGVYLYFTEKGKNAA